VSPECSFNKTGNERSAKGGLTRLHGDGGTRNEQMFLENTLQFVLGGGQLIMPTSAVSVLTSKVWEEAPHQAKERVTELCHVCVLVKCVPMQQVYYDKKLAKLLSVIVKWHNLHDDFRLNSPVCVIFALGVFLFNQGSDRTAHQDQRQPDQASAAEKKQARAAEKTQEEAMKLQMIADTQARAKQREAMKLQMIADTQARAKQRKAAEKAANEAKKKRKAAEKAGVQKEKEAKKKRKAGGAGGGAAGGGGPGWACAACTFVNNTSASGCEICG
jgi:hypothetical protein